MFILNWIRQLFSFILMKGKIMSNQLYQLLTKSLSMPKQELGDRRKYVGSSDLGCPLKSYYQKTKGDQPKTLSQLFVLRRGDMVEEILKQALQDCTNVKYQVMYVHPEYSYIKAHCDFEFAGKHDLGVMEVKSVGNNAPLPSKPYDNWVDQLHYQMGLAKLNNPDKNVKGCIVAIDISNGTFKIYNSIVYDEIYFKKLIDRAQQIFNAVENKNHEGLEAIQSPLCNYCHFRTECPTYFYSTNEKIVDLTYLYETIQDFLTGQVDEKIGKELKATSQRAIKEALSQFKYGSCNIDGQEIVLKRIDVKKRTFDEAKFKEENPDLYEKYLKDTKFSYIRAQ